MSAVVIDGSDEVLILSRAVDAERGGWSVETARGILSISLSEEDRMRSDELAAKARDGSLTVAEEIEIENYRRAGRLLELLKSKARASLRRNETGK